MHKKFLGIAVALIGMVGFAFPINSMLGADGAELVNENECDSLPRSYLVMDIPSDFYEVQVYFSGTKVRIDWGDGQFETPTKSPVSHVFAHQGIYEIQVNDAATQFGIVDGHGRDKILEVGFGWNVVSIADAGYLNATSLIKISCAPSVQTCVNRTFHGCTSLDWVCDFPSLNMDASRFGFLPMLDRQVSYLGQFSVEDSPGTSHGDVGTSLYIAIMALAPYDMMDLLPSLLATAPVFSTHLNFCIRRIWLPAVQTVIFDAFYGLPNLYGVYCPEATQISSCITRNSGEATNNPLGVIHIRLGHLDNDSQPTLGRVLCWGGSENYLGVFMVDMTREELGDWLATRSVANFISDEAFQYKAICTDDPEWDEWNEWFENGMEIEDVPMFPLDR